MNHIKRERCVVVMTGKLHSIETMGLVDGPGIRTVFFLQGCPLRCLYCHNPDSQSFKGEKTITTEEVVALASRYKSYYKASGGGVTFSGGEPLMQGEFVLEAFKALKAEGITTCVDTSGYGQMAYYQAIFQVTDHILLDIKHPREEMHKEITGLDMSGIRNFIQEVSKGFDGTVTIRHVMVPGYSDSSEIIEEILDIIEPIQKKVDKIDILPYHKAGTEKYSQLNIPYQLETVPAMNQDRANIFQKEINEKLNVRKKKTLSRIA